MSKVYLTKFNSHSFSTNIPNKIKKLYGKVAMENGDNDLVAIKLHFGEKGNTTFIHPVYVRTVVDLLKESKYKPFLTDTNTLYTGSRTNSIDHITTAIENGFAFSVVNAPIIIADGINSKNFYDVEINKKHFHKVKIASEIENVRHMVVLSHFKGHGMAGFGGAIKNLAMGCASASGKMMQHSDAAPKVKTENCIGCGLCVKECPVEAISLFEKKAVIDRETCYGCGECVTRCPVRAINNSWKTENNTFLEKMVEFAYGAVKNKEKVVYINFLMNVTPLCDCVPWSGEKLVNDIGILASDDPIALDKACNDLVKEGAGKDVFKELYPEIKTERLLEYGEEIGLGTRSYELLEI